MYKLHGQITLEFLGLRMQNFQGIVFIWTQTYRETFKSALVYLSDIFCSASVIYYKYAINFSQVCN